MERVLGLLDQLLGNILIAQRCLHRSRLQTNFFAQTIEHLMQR